LLRLETISKKVADSLRHKIEDVYIACDLMTARITAKVSKSMFVSELRKIDTLLLRALNSLKSYTALKQSKLVKLDTSLKAACSSEKLAQRSNLMSKLESRCHQAWQRYYREYTHKLDLISSRLNNTNPDRILKLGYAFITKGDAIISSISDVRLNDELYVELSDGKLKSQVLELNKKNNN
jgi:exodeoxyribonuclease VII large subunit